MVFVPKNYIIGPFAREIRSFINTQQISYFQSLHLSLDMTRRRHWNISLSTQKDYPYSINICIGRILEDVLCRFVPLSTEMLNLGTMVLWRRTPAG